MGSPTRRVEEPLSRVPPNKKEVCAARVSTEVTFRQSALIGRSGMWCFRMWGFNILCVKPLTHIISALGVKFSYTYSFEGQSTIIFKPHILKHHIPELPTLVFAPLGAPSGHPKPCFWGSTRWGSVPRAPGPGVTSVLTRAAGGFRIGARTTKSTQVLFQLVPESMKSTQILARLVPEPLNRHKSFSNWCPNQ